jgi:hypothetical protein
MGNNENSGTPSFFFTFYCTQTHANLNSGAEMAILFHWERLLYGFLYCLPPLIPQESGG